MGAIAEFAFVLLLAGGFIAWLGDRLGTYVGKKRLSRFGLRPKHTAMLYTIISGSLIAGLTLLVLLLYDRSVSRALLRGDQIFAQIKAQETEIARLNRDRAAEIASESQARQQAQQAVAQAADAQKLSDLMHRRLTVDEKRYAESRRQFETQLSDAKLRLATADRRLSGAQALYDSVKRSLTVTAADLHSTKQSVAEKLTELDRAGKQLRSAQVEVSQSLSEVLDLTEKGKVLSARNQQLTRENGELQSGKVIYHTGDEVGRCEVMTGASLETVRKQLSAWLAELGREADRAGAGAGKDGREVVVDDAPPNSTPSEASQDESLDALAGAITDQRGIVSSVVVMATARYNTLVGEQVKIHLQPFNNVLVFTKGEAIASTAIDGTMPVDKIVNALGRFLTNTVKPIVIKDNVMPQVDPVTREVTYAEPIEEWYRTVRKIQDIGATARVTAVASTDVFTRGPVKMHFDITSSAPAPALPVRMPQATPPSGMADGSGGVQASDAFAQ